MDEMEELSEQCGEFCCTTMFFLIPKNVTSERPVALMPTLIRWWGAFEGTRSGKGADEVPC